MRTVTTTTNVYSYDELSDEAKSNARDEVYGMIDTTDEIRYVVAAFLTSEAWENIDPAEGQDGDRNTLIVQATHSQGDFVAFASVREGWNYNGTEYRVRTTMRPLGGNRMQMDVYLTHADDTELDGDGTMPGHDELIEAAESMVEAHAAEALNRGLDADMNATDPDGYVQGIIEANDYEFLGNGSPYRG